VNDGDRSEKLACDCRQPSSDEHAGTHPDPSRKSSLADLAQASALVTGFVGAIYFLGLVALWMPVARLHTKDFTTALYAVSLAPRTFVAGQGVKNFLGPSLANVLYAAMAFLLLLTITSVLWEISGKHSRLTFLQKGGAANAISAGVVVGLLMVTVYAIPEETGFSITGFDFRSAGPGGSVLVSTALVLSLVGGIFGGYTLFRGLDVKEGEYFPHVSNRRAIIKGLIVTFIVALIASFPAAAAKTPPLPWVEVIGTEQSNNVEGFLVNHSEGSWYILKHDSQMLVVVRDDQIDTANIFRKKDQ
jgi:hypothetical protein